MTRIIITLLISLIGWVFPVHSAAAQTSVIKTNAIQPALSKIQQVREQPIRSHTNSGLHSTRAETQITSEVLTAYLESVNSPLAGYAGQILQSPYWSTIIGICTIEESNCSINPYGTNNFWGIMSRSHLVVYPTMEAGIAGINNFLDNAYNNGRTTVESFKGWYCASECTNWESTVLSTKQILESLN